MKKLALSILCLLSLPFGGRAQESVSEMLPAHASALQKFLSVHPDLEFLSERDTDKGVMKWMRKDFGARFTPFYHRGDFNNDGSQDFAIVLVKDAPPEVDLSLDESHRYRHQVTIVIFNGIKGGKFRAAFIKSTTAPLVCFINLTGGKKKILYFGVYETDEGFHMTPAGTGYIAEY